ncbi:MAG: hypothetical protein F9K48_09915, partial [Candidatus Brocadia sp.]
MRSRNQILGIFLQTFFWLSLMCSFVILVLNILNRDIRFYGRIFDTSGNNLGRQASVIVLVDGQEAFRGTPTLYNSGIYEFRIPNTFGYALAFPQEMPIEDWGTATTGEVMQFYPPDQQRIHVAFFSRGDEPNCSVSTDASNTLACSSAPPLRLANPPISIITIISFTLTIAATAILGVTSTMKNDEPKLPKKRNTQPRATFNWGSLIIAVLSI